MELRFYSRSARHGGGSQPEPEGIVVPVHALSELCHLLEQTHNHILKEGLVNVPTLGNLIVSEDGAQHPPHGRPTYPRARCPPRASCVSQTARRVLYIGCSERWTSQLVTGKIGDLSSESAQIRLTREFAVGSRLAVLMNMRELTFRGQAEVVEAAPHPPNGYFQHSIRWVALNPQAKATLATIIESAGHPGP